MIRFFEEYEILRISCKDLRKYDTLLNVYIISKAIRIHEGDIIEVDIYLNVSSKVLQSLF